MEAKNASTRLEATKGDGELRKEEYVVPFLATAVVTVEGDGKLVEKRKPVESVLALEMLAEGRSYTEITEKTGLGVTALSALKARHPMALEQRRSQLATDAWEMAEKLRHLVGKKVEMLIDDEDAMKKVNIRDLVLPYGIAMDKGLQVLGEQKIVIEHRKGRPSLEDAQKAIAEARAELARGAIDVTGSVTQP
jgi:uncharacterized protein YerC